METPPISLHELISPPSKHASGKVDISLAFEFARCNHESSLKGNGCSIGNNLDTEHAHSLFPGVRFLYQFSELNWLNK